MHNVPKNGYGSTADVETLEYYKTNTAFEASFSFSRYRTNLALKNASIRKLTVPGNGIFKMQYAYTDVH